MHRISLNWLLLGVLLWGSVSIAQMQPLAFVGGHLIPVTGEEIRQGTLVIQRGKIVSVGTVDSVHLPRGARRVDISGKVLMPGLICTHSHIGGRGGGDRSHPIQADARILDAINVKDSGFKRAQAGGLTTLNIMPGSGHLLSGQTVYVKLRQGNAIEDLLIRTEDGGIAGGIKMANGTNSQQDPPFPGTRGKSAALVRQTFIKAQEYRDRKARPGEDPNRVFETDLAMEALVEVLEGKRIVHHHTHRHDDIMTVLRLAKEFNFRVVLHHVSEGWKVAEEIAAAGVPCSLIILDSPGGKLEAVHIAYRTGAVLDKAGVSIAYHTDDFITDSRWFLRSPAMGIRAGLDRQTALASVTINGAKMLDLDQRIGSLEVGKDADFIVLSGDPFSVYTKVLQTWVEGRTVFDRSQEKDRLYAVGGYGASHDQNVYLCCQGGQE